MISTSLEAVALALALALARHLTAATTFDVPNISEPH
jgi:hypothetical protein